MANVLLVGNGPNYFSAGVSWTDVVRATARHARLANQTEKIIHEPLPLVYETIAARYPQKEKRARLELAKEMRRLVPNDIHRDLMGLGWATTLTTNYDHCLEQASGESFVPANLRRETTYSRFRRARSKSRSIWHIHGDLAGPRTMMLGMHHYCGYLQKLREYLTTKAEKSPFVFGDHSQPIESGRHSWADLFLRDDVHIVGLGLSYAEVGLWWLLGYKFRLRHQKKLPCGSTTYYVMGVGDPSEKHRIELMMAYGVTIKVVKGTVDPPTRKTWRDLVEMLKSPKKHLTGVSRAGADEITGGVRCSGRRFAVGGAGGETTGTDRLHRHAGMMIITVTRPVTSVAITKHLIPLLWIAPGLALLADCASVPAGGAREDPGPQWWLQGTLSGAPLSGPAVVTVSPAAPTAPVVAATSDTPFSVAASGSDSITGLDQLTLLADITVCTRQGTNILRTAAIWGFAAATTTPYPPTLRVQGSPDIAKDMGSGDEVDYKITTLNVSAGGKIGVSQPLLYQFVRPGLQRRPCLP